MHKKSPFAQICYITDYLLELSTGSSIDTALKKVGKNRSRASRLRRANKDFYDAEIEVKAIGKKVKSLTHTKLQVEQIEKHFYSAFDITVWTLFIISLLVILFMYVA